jgi:hypothetical protein
MEEILAVVLFGVGAAAGMKAVSIVGSGLRPVARGIVRGGAVAAETVRGAAERAGDTVANVTAEARRNLKEVEDEVRAERRASSPPHRPSTPRKIDVIRE